MISNLLTALNECFMPFATFRQYDGKTLYPAPNGARLQVRFHKVNRT